VEVADVVTAPIPGLAWIPIDERPETRIGDKGGTHVAIDARVDQEGAEDLGAILQADAERGGEVGDVRVTLHPVGAAPVAANGPLFVRQHLAGRNKPQPSVAEKRRRRRPRLLRCGGRRGLSLGGGRTLSRGCPGRPGLCASARRHGERYHTSRGYASCHESPPKRVRRPDHSTRSAVALSASVALGVAGSDGTMRRPRPPRLTWPPLRPALRASSA